MIRSIALVAALCAVTACERAAPDMTAAERDARAPVAAEDLDTNEIACALDGAKVFADVCAVERVRGKDGLLLVIRHPDGGFRRLSVLDDGRGVAVADGAEAAAVAVAGDTIEVAVGDSRYRIPATVRPNGR